jgi:DnaJ-class molecular chaperone
LYLDEKRKMNDRPVRTGESEFANARLPAADDEAIATMPPAHEVLDVAPDASRDVIEAAARAKKGETHPDVHGGDRESFERVKRAEERLLDDRGVEQ